MFLLPLSGDAVAALPHVLLSSGYPAVPNPSLESQLLQSVWSLPLIPILALDGSLERPQMVLKPSSLQLVCNEPREPNSVFHVSRPKEVARYLPSAINEYRELAFLLMTMKFISWLVFIPRQILEKGVFQ